VLANGRLRFVNLDRRRMFEVAALAAGLLAAFVAAYLIQDSTTENFTVWILLTLPFLLWSALRFGSGLSSIMMMTVTLITLWILHGNIVPSENTWPAQVISNLQLFLGLSAVFLVLLSARTEERTNAEDSLREQEAQYRSVVETQSDLICRYLPDSTLTFVNEAYCRFFDKSRDELIGARFINFIPEGDRRAVLEHIASIVETKIDSAHEHEVIRSNGEIGWHHWINQPIVDNGEVTELQGIGRDITDRKRIEQALSVSQSVFQNMADSLPILVYLMGKDGDLTFANKALLEFHGLDLVISMMQISWRAFTRTTGVGETAICRGIS
jgi:PAS domain S-box-containing protein